MTGDKETKRTVLKKVCNFYLLDDLIELADAQILITKILKEEQFPFLKYKQWLKKQNPES